MAPAEGQAIQRRRLLQPAHPRTAPASAFDFVHRTRCRTLVRVHSPESEPKDYVHSEAFLHTLMRRQLRLSIGCALSFLVALLGLPLLNYFLPELMAVRVGGFTLTWLLLGVLFFPLVWAIAWIFIRRSIALEESEVREVDPRKREG